MRMLKFMIIIVLGIFLVAALYPAPVAATERPATPAASGNVKLTIQNKTPGPVRITLSGPKNYTITAAPGKTVQEILKGKYTYEYKACGTTKKGKFTATASAKINIAKCKMARVTMVNYTSGQMTLRLTGPANYFFTVPARTAQRVDVLEGTYRWTITACGRSNSGTITLKGKKNVAMARGC